MTMAATGRIVTAASVLFMSAMLVLAGVDAYSARQASRTLDALKVRRLALGSAIRAAQREISEDAFDAAEIRAAMAVPGAANPAPYRMRSVQKFTELERLAIAASEPRLRELSIRALRAGLPRHFGPLFRTLNLGSDQREEMQSLESRRWEAEIAIVAAAAEKGIPADDPSVGEMLRRETAQTEAAQEALLGEEGYRQLRQFNRSQPVMELVDAVANTAAITSTPLTSSQQDQLLRVLAESSAQFLAGGTATAASVDWPPALAQARAILLPSQYPALEAVYDQGMINQLASRFYGLPWPPN
jgi:hypothetical protein